MTTRSHPSQITATISLYLDLFDQLNQMSASLAENLREVDISYVYTGSNVTSEIIKDPVDLKVIRKTDYEYDPATGSVVSESVTANSITIKKSYQYDSNGNVTGIQIRKVP